MNLSIGRNILFSRLFILEYTNNTVLFTPLPQPVRMVYSYILEEKTQVITSRLYLAKQVITSFASSCVFILTNPRTPAEQDSTPCLGYLIVTDLT